MKRKTGCTLSKLFFWGSCAATQGTCFINVVQHGKHIKGGRLPKATRKKWHRQTTVEKSSGGRTQLKVVQSFTLLNAGTKIGNERPCTHGLSLPENRQTEDIDRHHEEQGG